MNKKKIMVMLTFFCLLLIAVIIGFQLLRKDDSSFKSEILPTDYDGITFRVKKEEAGTHNMHIMYPITPNVKINNDAEAVINVYVSKFKDKVANRSDRDGKVWDLNITGDVDYYTDKVINFTYKIRNYTGQSNDLELNRLYDIQTGDIIQASDLFKDDTYLSVLSNESRKQLPSILGEKYSEEMVNKGTDLNTSNFKVFELNDHESFTVVFEPGQVAPVELGTVKAKIKTNVLIESFNDKAKDMLKEVSEAIQEQAKREQTLSQRIMNAPVQPSNGQTDCSKEKCIALTFDDGPGRYGNELLDLLDQHKVKASFFYIGRQVAGYSNEVKRAYDAGHDIGNHTWDHANMKHESNDQLRQEVENTNQAILQATGVRPILLRPPYGAYNNDQVGLLGMPFILWNVDPDDWKDKDANTIYDRVMSSVGNGKVVLSHEIYPTTIEAYKRIIPDLLGQGYKLVTITDLHDIDTTNPIIKVYSSR